MSERRFCVVFLGCLREKFVIRSQWMVFGVLCCAAVTGSAQEFKSGVEWDAPPVVTPGDTDREAPSDAIVLFDGSSLDAWHGGEDWIISDGVAIPAKHEIRTRQEFRDVQLHIEWSAPTEIEGSGQGRGNSGIFLMGKYEIQVLDSYENETYFDGQAASVYKQTPPMANAMRKPGEWNTYDIFFTAPVFRVNGDVERPACVTVIHNGVLVLNHFEILGPTSYVAAPHYEPHADVGPISLQFHNDPVRFRNIWVRELHPPVGRRTGPGYNIQPKRPPKKSVDNEENQQAGDTAEAGESENQPGAQKQASPASQDDTANQASPEQKKNTGDEPVSAVEQQAPESSDDPEL